MSKRKILSLVLATRNRARSLQSTLSALMGAQPREDWEVIVVDNSSADNTQAVLLEMQRYLPIMSVSEPLPSKAKSINRALELAQGDFIVFTDDDVLPARQWLSEMLRAFRRYTNASVFCGPITPLFPDGTPNWMRDHPYAGPAFGRFTPSLPEGPLGPFTLPFGGNFAVRSRSLHGLRMDENLGPSAENLMGEDMQFIRTLRDRTGEIIFIPSAYVRHCIRPEQVTLPWLFDRAFAWGRSTILDTAQVVVFPMPPNEQLAHSARRSFELGVLLNFYLGQLYQLSLKGDESQCLIVRKAISALQCSGDPTILGRSAAQFLATDPQHASN